MPTETTKSPIIVLGELRNALANAHDELANASYAIACVDKHLDQQITDKADKVEDSIKSMIEILDRSIGKIPVGWEAAANG